MWTRRELKSRAKYAIALNYGRSVLMAIIIGLSAGGAFYTNTSGVSDNQTQDTGNLFQSMTQTLQNISPQYLMAVASSAASVGILMLIISIFLFQPLEVGGRKFFLDDAKKVRSATMADAGFAFQNGNYWNIAKTMFVTNLYQFLWSLLFFIPGIIKSYSYRMVPYILAENPDISTSEAITRSREMMDGNKWNTFVLDLSFILWNALSMMTFGIVGFLYVNPYIYATDAQLYLAIRPAETTYDQYNDTANNTSETGGNWNW